MSQKDKTFTDQLQVDFTPEELRVKGLELAHAMLELDNIDTERKQVADDYKKKLVAKGLQIKTLKDQINNGYDFLPVECIQRMNDPQPGLKTTYRQDTGDKVGTYDMTMSERQLKIDDFEDIGTVDGPQKPETNSAQPIVEREPMTVDKYVGLATTAETKAANDAKEFGFPIGRISKLAESIEPRILLQDETGTIFTFGEDGSIFFDPADQSEESLAPANPETEVKKTEFNLDQFDTVEKIQTVLNGMANDIAEAEVGSEQFQFLDKNIKLLQAKLKKLTKPASKKKATKPEQQPPVESAYQKQTVDWFRDHVGKKIDANSNAEGGFVGVMDITDIEHAEFLFTVSQEQQGFTFRDVAFG